MKQINNMKTKIEDIIGKEIKDLGVIFKLTDKLHKLFSKEVEEIERYLLDHYWDSLDEEMVKLHIKAVFKKLAKEKGI